jgi:hypothetical protein
MTQRLICEVKTYSTGYPWLSVYTPADPANENFELRVTTNDYSLAGPYTVNLVVGFSRADLTMTFTQTFSVKLLHPCKTTVITTSQNIASITHQFGDPVTITSFTAYSDSVATQYGVSSLCALVYSLTVASDATSFGVTVNSSSLKISTLPTDHLKINQNTNLTLHANSSTAQQDTASQTVTFNVSVTDPCPNTVI